MKDEFDINKINERLKWGFCLPIAILNRLLTRDIKKFFLLIDNGDDQTKINNLGLF